MKKKTVCFGQMPCKSEIPYIVKVLIDITESADEVTEKTVEECIKNKEVKTEKTLGYYLTSLAKKANMNPAEYVCWFKMFSDMYPYAGLAVLLKEIALNLDNKYPDHISKCEKYFVVSMTDGRIHEMPRAHIKSFKNFAAFRTLEDAKFACRILRKEIKKCFGNDRKQEDKKC